MEELRQEDQIQSTEKLCFLAHAQLFSYDVQIHLPIGDAHHGGLGPSTSIETISQTCSQANQGHLFI